MEDVLEVYHRPYDPKRPQVCLDEASRQLLEDLRPSLPMEPGQPLREDSEYQRNGTVNLFMLFEPLAGRRHVEVTDRRTALDFAQVVKELLTLHYPEAETVVLVMDNLNTHKLASLYEAFPPEEARALCERLEIHPTPKHGSWLNMAEIELSVLARQCLDRRMPDKAYVTAEVAAWEQTRNQTGMTVDWRFTTEDARIKLKKLYPCVLP
jgi:DDE superfamily endonuclease